VLRTHLLALAAFNALVSFFFLPGIFYCPRFAAVCGIFVVIERKQVKRAANEPEMPMLFGHTFAQ